MKRDIESRLQAMEDQLAIHALAARFSDCANERDYDEFAKLWAHNSVWEIGPPLPSSAVGVEPIVEMLRRLLNSQTGFMQMTHSGVIWIDGDKARARFVQREHGFSKGGGAGGADSYYENLAVYIDEIVRESDGQWRFSERVYEYRYLDTSPFGGQVFPPSRFK